ncbi:hypothetical protein LTR86_004652 [Recurvomyces mirabilis]|nr:hypothetical protein LTR86_004652 [Recurvomyces mirabilis]
MTSQELALTDLMASLNLTSGQLANPDLKQAALALTEALAVIHLTPEPQTLLLNDDCTPTMLESAAHDLRATRNRFCIQMARYFLLSQRYLHIPTHVRGHDTIPDGLGHWAAITFEPLLGEQPLEECLLLEISEQLDIGEQGLEGANEEALKGARCAKVSALYAMDELERMLDTCELEWAVLWESDETIA